MAEKYAALIAGGTKGIGLAIGVRLSKPGAHIFLSYASDDAAAKAAAAKVKEKGGTPHTIKADIGTAEGGRAVIDAVAKVTDRLDAIVHSAAVPNPGYLATQDMKEIRHAIDVGGMALLYLVQPAMKLLAEGSTVLFLSGASTTLVLPHHGALAAAKALGECFVRYLAVECASKGINFNTLGSGPVDTELFRSVRPAHLTGEAALPPATLNGKRLVPEDLADVAEFLLSKAGRMVRGQNILVDGGLSTTTRAK
jgi:NAD(P)-dependent dehydrogenase (short-subunit alcohol dehydrogenase family)